MEIWKTLRVSHIPTPPATTTDKCLARRYTNTPLGTKDRSGQDADGVPPKNGLLADMGCQAVPLSAAVGVRRVAIVRRHGPTGCRCPRSHSTSTVKTSFD